MQITFFSFIMSLLWFNIYIIIINAFRKKDNFIVSFSTFPLVFFLLLSIFRLIFNFEVPGAIIVRSTNVFPKLYDFIINPLYFKKTSVNILQLFIVIWIIITIILIVNSILKYKIFKNNIKRINRSRNKNNQQVFNKLLNQKKMKNKMEIIQHDNISSPFILGITKGEIYIPNINFSQEELEYIISHETYHFLGKDFLKKIVIQSMKYVFWWNPFAHLFANNFNHILEIQCDLKTTADFSDEKKIRYLESITKIIDNSARNTIELSSVPNFIGMGDIDSLKQRFRIVLNYKEKRKVSNIGLCLLALSLYAASYFIIIQPYYNPNNSELQEEETISNSFIIEKSDGNYDIYIDNIFNHSIKDLRYLKEGLGNLPIYKEGGIKNDN